VGCKVEVGETTIPSSFGFTLTMWDVKVEVKTVEEDEIKVLP